MPQEVFLFNTLSRSVEPLITLEPGKVRLYTCGPTVYHFAHIGNLRTYVFEDVLKRTLSYAGYAVHHVMNITDVGHLVSDGDDGEDKMEKGARREGKSAWDIAKFYTEVFFQDLAKLNIIPPEHDCIPRATDYVPQMIRLVQDLEKKGFTYRTSDGIYFDTGKFPRYGDLARLDVENLEAGKRIAMGDKQRPTDFALWKFSPPQEKRQMEWDSPWGKGFPGWHIECSAMAMDLLGETLDIHCGGKDHIPVHHTNEIAQSEAATGKKFSRIWMHSAFLNEDSEKMSKSTGKILTISVLEENGYSALDYRYLLLQAHYRSELNFHWEGLKAAQSGRKNLLGRLAEISKAKTQNFSGTFSPAAQKLRTEFQRLIFQDLNTAAAMAILFAALRDTASAVLLDTALSPEEKLALAFDFDRVLGLRLEEELAVSAQKNLALDPATQALITARDQARKDKNWAESDRLRNELQALGWTVKDSNEGTKVSK